MNPLRHWLEYGQAEGRLALPSIGPVGTDGFDAKYYLLANPDVALAGVDPLSHFNNNGWHEGRNPNAFFDTSGYLARYADVAAAGANPLQHYMQYGFLENRDPSGAFDTAGYKALNPDVAAAGMNPLLHFMQYGAREGRMFIGDGVLG